MTTLKRVRGERGQAIVVFSVGLMMAIICAGVGIDAGLLYATKVKLTTAVDGACLTTMKSLSQGQPAAAALGTKVFDINYGSNPPTPSITFPTDANGNQQVTVSATANVHTLFMQLLPQWGSVPVSAKATATRGKLIMSIVVDRSGSMVSDKGAQALQSAVPTFVGDFNDSTDEVGLISFASNATVDVPVNYSFKSPIQTTINSMTFSGGTFGTGAGTQSILNNNEGPPLSLAKLQNDSVTVQQGQNVVKVIVYVTDGLMNTIQDNFSCPATTLLNYGGYDSGTSVDILDPNTGTDWGTYSSTQGFPYDSKGDICKNSSKQIVKTFPSQQYGTQESLTRSNVTTEAQYRAIQTAIALRTQSPIPTYIFTIGVGSGVSSSTQAFLAQLANDPSYTSTYISGQPAGLFFYIANCPSSTCTTDIQAAFQTIAAKVMLRLTG